MAKGRQSVLILDTRVWPSLLPPVNWAWELAGENASNSKATTVAGILKSHGPGERASVPICSGVPSSRAISVCAVLTNPCQLADTRLYLMSVGFGLIGWVPLVFFDGASTQSDSRWFYTSHARAVWWRVARGSCGSPVLRRMTDARYGPRHGGHLCGPASLDHREHQAPPSNHKPYWPAWATWRCGITLRAFQPSWCAVAAHIER